MWKRKLKRSWLGLIGARRRTRPAGVALILSLGLILSVGLALGRTAADVATPDARTTLDLSAALGVNLPHADGFGLLPKPPAFTKEESDRLFAEGKRACDGPCVTNRPMKLTDTRCVHGVSIRQPSTGMRG